MVPIAPGYPIPIFNPDNPWIIAILETSDFGIIVLPFNRIIIQLPVNTIIAETAMQIHLSHFIVTSKNASEFPLMADGSTVENAV
jgi:hypothetical protein